MERVLKLSGPGAYVALAIHSRTSLALRGCPCSHQEANGSKGFDMVCLKVSMVIRRFLLCVIACSVSLIYSRGVGRGGVCARAFSCAGVSACRRVCFPVLPLKLAYLNSDANRDRLNSRTAGEPLPKPWRARLPRPARWGYFAEHGPWRKPDVLTAIRSALRS